MMTGYVGRRIYIDGKLVGDWIPPTGRNRKRGSVYGFGKLAIGQAIIFAESKYNLDRVRNAAYRYAAVNEIRVSLNMRRNNGQNELRVERVS